MICGAADEGSAALFVCGGEGRIWLRRRGARLRGRCHDAGARSWGWRTGGWAGFARRANRREFVD